MACAQIPYVRAGWMAASLPTASAGRSRDKAKEAIAKPRCRWARLGDPADVANAVVFLASQQASYVTGEALSVDGGWKL